MNPFKLFYYWLFDIKPCEHHWETEHRDTKSSLEKFEEAGHKAKEGLSYDIVMGLTQHKTITTTQCTECGKLIQTVTNNNDWVARP